jgi:putative flippase GtrA
VPASQRAWSLAVAGQFSRFVVVGASNTLLSFVTYIAAVRLGSPYPLAAAAGFAAGAVNGYLLNRRWTFGSDDSAGARVRYLGVQLGGLLATSTLLWAFMDAGLGHIAGYLLAVPIVTVAMFVANRQWTFADASRRTRTAS